MADKGGPRRGSSLFSGGGGGPPPSNRPPQQQGGSGKLPTAPVSAKRQSTVLQMPAGGLGFLQDFDSDYDDSDDDQPPHGGPHGGGPPQARAPAPAPSTGGPNHRPYVGGFAAAAYEAARSHHNQGSARQPKERSQPKPSGRRPQGY